MNERTRNEHGWTSNESGKISGKVELIDKSINERTNREWTNDEWMVEWMNDLGIWWLIK